jgi:hypothetical protein
VAKAASAAIAKNANRFIETLLWFRQFHVIAKTNRSALIRAVKHFRPKWNATACTPVALLKK